MKVLVINAGSSSLKFTVFETNTKEMLARGLVERIGLVETSFRYESHRLAEPSEEGVRVENHAAALAVVCAKLVDPQVGVLQELRDIGAIGHRVVHGGERFQEPVVVDLKVKNTIRKYAALAPLHNPANLGGIVACEKAFPKVPNVAVFDTAFHQTMPPAAYLFAIPYEYYRDEGVRKYGFHGTSHKYVYQASADLLGLTRRTAKLITCHLGNGCSVAAVDGGHVLDTSMGLTPLMGLVMGTRCGDIDPGVFSHLLRHGLTGEDIDVLLNKKSGLLGLAGIGSSDMRDIIAAAAAGTARAQCALDVFVHRVVHYIGAYYTLLGGADAVVFTGGIGENSAEIRERIVTRLRVLGCLLQKRANSHVNGAAVISTARSRLKAVVMPTDEELMIALETVLVLQGAGTAETS